MPLWGKGFFSFSILIYFERGDCSGDYAPAPPPCRPAQAYPPVIPGHGFGHGWGHGSQSASITPYHTWKS